MDFLNFANIEVIPSNEVVEKIIDEINELELNDFEISEEAFYRYQRQNEYIKMFMVALNIFSDDKVKAKLFFELTAKCALEADNIEFAWKSALQAGQF
jgi:hypothetical protein